MSQKQSIWVVCYIQSLHFHFSCIILALFANYHHLSLIICSQIISYIYLFIYIYTCMSEICEIKINSDLNMFHVTS